MNKKKLDKLSPDALATYYKDKQEQRSVKNQGRKIQKAEDPRINQSLFKNAEQTAVPCKLSDLKRSKPAFIGIPHKGDIKYLNEAGDPIHQVIKLPDECDPDVKRLVEEEGWLLIPVSECVSLPIVLESVLIYSTEMHILLLMKVQL